jgi:hypothetical protein
LSASRSHEAPAAGVTPVLAALANHDAPPFDTASPGA